MFTRIACALLVAAVPAFAAAPGAAGTQEQEHKKVPSDSIEVTVTGCIKGRVIRASDVRQVDTSSGPDIRQRTFRLAGSKELMKQVKDNDGHMVEVIGIIKKSALIESGMKFKGGRVVVGGGTASPGSIPDPAENTVVMDLSAVTQVGDSCR